MVVVVDESESESATTYLEEQLVQLGERWITACKWIETRYVKLTSYRIIEVVYSVVTTTRQLSLAHGGGS